MKGGCGASPDSDDDGFFEQSSVGSAVSGEAGAALAAWQAAVLARAAAAEARGGLDVRALGRRVLRALAGPAPAPQPFAAVLRSTARSDAEVSHVLLSTLFLVSRLDSLPIVYFHSTLSTFILIICAFAPLFLPLGVVLPNTTHLFLLRSFYINFLLTSLEIPYKPLFKNFVLLILKMSCFRTNSHALFYFKNKILP